MLQIAHRGYGNNIYNDNSFDAYENAFNNKFDMIEMDVQLCKSGEVIIYHDIYIKNKLIRNINYCDLLPTGIKTFKDFLIEKYNKNMNILLDIKGTHINVVDKILILCNKFNVNYSKIWMSSFNKIVITDLIKFKNIYKYAVGLISDNNFYYDEIKYQLDKINFISINFEMLISSGEELLNECKHRNIKIFVWTIQNKDQYELVQNIHIDGFITDIKLN
jgi:glycerophosphoryl diester phosphodiesterase